MTLLVLDLGWPTDGVLGDVDEFVNRYWLVILLVDRLVPSKAHGRNRPNGHVIHIGEVPPLGAVSINGDRLSFYDRSDEREYAHIRTSARSVDGAISQHNGVHAVQVVVGMQQGFGGGFWSSVRGQWTVDQSILRYGAVPLAAIDARCRGQDELSSAKLPAQLQQIEGAEHVGLVVSPGASTLARTPALAAR